MGNVKTLTSSVTSLKKELSGVYDVLKQIKGIGPSAFGDVNAVLSKSGQFGNGQGSTVFGKTPVNPAPKFSSQTKMGAAQPGSNAQQSNYEKTATAMHTQYLDMGIRQAKFGVAAGVVAATTSVVSGVMGMLPNTGQVAQRAGMFYGASAMFGGTNRAANQRATFNAMRGGITSDMGDAEAFSTLTNFSFMPGSKNMAMGLGQVSAAAKALGMDNAIAANAIGGMSTGSAGAQLYQYGIRQYDDKGNLRKSGDVSKDILQRIFYPGKDVTKIGAEQFAKDSMGMNLDYQLATLGITGAEAVIRKAEMGRVVTGQNPNLESVDTSGSPLKAFLDVQSQETKLVQATEADILKGAEKAAAALKILNEKLEQTPSLIVQLNSALQTFTASKSGGNLVDSVVKVGSGVVSAVMASKAMKYLKNMRAGATPLADDVAKVANTGKIVIDPVTGAASHSANVAATASNASKLATVSRVAGKVALPVTVAVAGYDTHKILTDKNLAAYDKKWNEENKDASFFDRLKEATNLLGDYLSGKDYGTTGNVGGGPTDGFLSNVGGNSSTVNAFTFSSGAQPMASGPLAASMGATSISKVIGAGFGAKDPSMTMAGALNYHTGQDTPMPVGTPVYARFAGKVVERNLSRDLGIAVEVDHGDGYSSIYGHLNLKSVRSGQEIKVGDLLGKSGSTGRVRGPHLHFELRKGKVPTDPKGYDPFVPNNKSDGKKGTASSAAGASVGPADVSAGIKASGKELHAWLMTLGLSSNGATGVLGNLIQESGLRTGAVGDKGSSFGIAQWHKGRGDALKKFAASKGMAYTDLEAQKLFLWKEMQTYPSMVKTLKDPNVSVLDAAALFMRKFERPKDQSDTAASKRASLGIGAIQGGPKDGFNTNVPTATLGTDMAVKNPGVATSLQGQTNNIYVTLQIQQANQQEAEAFAKTLKKYLEKDNKLQKIGSN